MLPTTSTSPPPPSLPLPALLVVALVLRTSTTTTAAGADLCDAPFCSCPDSAWGKVVCQCPAGGAAGSLQGGPNSSLELRAEGPYRLPEHTTVLVVEGCRRVEVHERAIHDLRHLRELEVRGASELLLLHQYAFQRPDGVGGAGGGPGENGGAHSLLLHHGSAPVPGAAPAPAASALDHGPRLLLEDSRVPAVPSYAFRGRVRAVSLRRCVIGTVSAFAFASLAVAERVHLSNCSVAAVESQAFKRFWAHDLVMEDTRFESPLPSRAFLDLTLRGDLRLEGVVAPALRPAALTARGPRSLTVRGCRFDLMQGDALRVAVRGPVRISDNNLTRLEAGAFLGLSADVGSERQSLSFSNNTLREFEAGSGDFNASAFSVRVAVVRVARPCECGSVGEWVARLRVEARELRCLDAGGAWVEDACESRVRTASPAVLFGALGAGVGALLVGILAAAAWRWRTKERKRRERGRGPGRRWAPSRDAKGKDSEELKGRTVGLVVPDGRVYVETELHVALERALPLDKDLE